MYKKAIGTLMLTYIMILAIFFLLHSIGEEEQTVGATEKCEVLVIGIPQIAASGQRVLCYQELAEKRVYSITEEERDILTRIVEAEAGGEDEKGKLLVANVVLNRVNNEQFPDSVTEVILQKNAKGNTQFSPVKSGRIWRVKVSEETISAVERALYGEDVSEGALYFAARKRANPDKMRWFDEELTFLFEHGGHEFFK